MGQSTRHAHDSATIKFIDGTSPTPLELTLVADAGNVSISGLKDQMRAVQMYQNRGRITALRKGAVEPGSYSHAFDLSRFSDADGATVLGWLAKKGDFAARKSTTEAIGDVDTTHVEITFAGSDNAGVDETILLNDVHLSADVQEGEPTRVSLTGTIYGDVDLDDATLFATPRVS